MLAELSKFVYVFLQRETIDSECFQFVVEFRFQLDSQWLPTSVPKDRWQNPPDDQALSGGSQPCGIESPPIWLKLTPGTSRQSEQRRLETALSAARAAIAVVVQATDEFRLWFCNNLALRGKSFRANTVS